MRWSNVSSYLLSIPVWKISQYYVCCALYTVRRDFCTHVFNKRFPLIQKKEHHSKLIHHVQCSVRADNNNFRTDLLKYREKKKSRTPIQNAIFDWILPVSMKSMWNAKPIQLNLNFVNPSLKIFWIMWASVPDSILEEFSFCDLSSGRFKSQTN